MVRETREYSSALRKPFIGIRWSQLQEWSNEKFTSILTYLYKSGWTPLLVQQLVNDIEAEAKTMSRVVKSTQLEDPKRIIFKPFTKQPKRTLPLNVPLQFSKPFKPNVNRTFTCLCWDLLEPYLQQQSPQWVPIGDLVSKIAPKLKPYHCAQYRLNAHITASIGRWCRKDSSLCKRPRIEYRIVNKKRELRYTP